MAKFILIRMEEDFEGWLNVDQVVSLQCVESLQFLRGEKPPWVVTTTETCKGTSVCFKVSWETAEEIVAACDENDEDVEEDDEDVEEIPF